MPETNGLKPGYEQTFFPPEEKTGKIKLVASRDARDGSVKINQDVSVYSSILAKDEEIEHKLAANRHAWLQVVKGSLEINGETLNAGDGAAISDEEVLRLKAGENETEFLLFDLA